MTSIGAFNASFYETQTFLSNLTLLKSRGIKVIYKDDVSPEFKSASQKNDYFKLYKCAIANFDYDILLSDDSIFQFSYKVNKGHLPTIRYAFFQNPQEYKSYEEYLEILRELGVVQGETNEEIGNSFDNEYQQFLSEQNLNASSMSIRYDLDQANYQPLVHPISHLHIGQGNNMRIPCDKILTPLKFALFVLKHVYYYEWKKLVEGGDVFLLKCLEKVKLSCPQLSTTHWTDAETKELFLS